MPNIPGIQSWNRLEPRPQNEDDYSRALKAEIRDPLWMMTRQWQFGEFKAEDAGSAIFTRVHLKTAELNKLQLANGAPVKDIDNTIPLEARVERGMPQFDLLMRIEMGRHWELLLRSKITQDIEIIISSYRESPGETIDLKFQVPTNNPNDTSESLFFSNPELHQAQELVADGRAIDGAAFYTWLKASTSNKASDYITDSAISSTVKTDIDTYAGYFTDWFEETYSLPTNETDTAWDNKHLVYSFSCGALSTSGSGGDVFSAEEYHQGSLDWYAFDFDKSSNPAAGLKVYDSAFVNEEKFTVIPSPAKFKGMPHPRWWKMEDGNVDFGDLNASKTDIIKLIFSDFGLIYSNDWMVFPYTVPAGSLSEVESVIVTDCFGQRTSLSATSAGNNDDWTRWSFFGLHTKDDLAVAADNRLFMPPVVDKSHESEAIESINFIRDEVANMVWGIERTIPSGLGTGMDGFESALKHSAFLKSKATPPPASNTDNGAEVKYQIASEVPENWIPFIPVKLDTPTDNRSIQLQRAAMPRQIDGLPGNDMGRVRPRTTLLTGPSPYYIFEEEVPRSGAIVKKTWQRARTESGKIITWFGTKKLNGRGEGHSNLSFDQIREK